ncbi:MAG: PKD domain-containing protein [Anaerolineae bacterium]|nr:PKD domain-containing protein [Anaerolineae bacterium]
MNDLENTPTESHKKPRRLNDVDALLLVFLLIGWLLIFLFATLGLYQVDEGWLPINPVVRAANYGVDAQDAPRLAQIKPEVVDAVKQDEKNREALKTPTPLTSLTPITPTTTLSPTPSPTNRPPLTINAGGPYEGQEGSEIALSASFDSLLGIIPGGVSYLWDLNGDGIYDDAEGAETTVTFLDEGDYPISVKVVDLIGREAIDTTVANVINVAPVVQIGDDIYTSEGRIAYFAATATDPGRDVLFYQWDFGDATIGVNNTLRPQHIFGDDGEYIVTLRVRDNDGGETVDTLKAYIGNLPPDPNAGPDRVINEGSPLTLKGSATDPAGDNDTLTYAWDLDYDGSHFEPDIEGEQVTHTYPDGPTNIVAALGVKDEDGGDSIDTVDITVNNVAPTIGGVSNSGPVGEGNLLNITISAADVGDDLLTYAFDWNNDGNYDTIQQSNSASNIWYNQGQYRVGLRVDDGDGGQVFSSTVVSTFNLTPTAIAQLPKQAYFEGSVVPFDGSESYDPGINDTLSYAWNFGDGATGSGANPSHTYADNGVYSTTLTVTDDSGAVDRDVIPVEILNANPRGNAGPDREIDEGEDVTISVIASEASDVGDDTLTFDWDFNFDGAFVSPADKSGQSATFTYPELDGPREIIVALRVRDDDYPAPTDSGGEIGEFIDTFRLMVKNVPPGNVDAGGPYKGIVTQPITLTAQTATDISDDPLMYAWDLTYTDNDSFTTDVRGQVVTHTWNTPGLYTVGLRVSDGDGGETFDTATVNVNAVPIANAGGPYSGLEGSPILFDGSASIDPDGDNLTYTWNFGDGTLNQTGITTTHVFSDNNIYTTTLTLRDSDGDASTDIVTATIFNANPTVTAIPNQTVNEGQPLTLAASATDPGKGDKLTYTWDFNYDGSNVDNDASGPNVTKTFPDGPATFTAALLVTDDDHPYDTSQGGQIGKALTTFQITVQNTPPIANAGPPNYNGVEGKPLTLNGSATDAGINDTLTFTWDLDDDGIFETFGSSPVKTWATGGIYPITLHVTDKDGASGTDTATVTIDSLPTAKAGGPYNGAEGPPGITFDGSGSFDPDSDTLTYTWNFGDGTPAGNGAAVSHVYLDNGSYTATLTVNDGRGGTATDQATVTITNKPPKAVTGGPYTGNEAQSITFDGSGSSDVSPNDTLSYAWNFGDGTPIVTSGVVVTHAYADNGIYNVSLQVTDDDGGTNTANTTATINNLNPTAEAGGPYITTINVAVSLTGSGTDVAADTLTFEWDLNNDGTFETSGLTPSHTWAMPGLKTVTFRVTDDDGGFTTDTATVDVGSPPTANPGGPYTANEGSSITFDGSASTDPDGDSLTYLWNFGDGSGTATGVSVSHTYVDEGTYTAASLTVNDGRGGVSTVPVTVTINNVAPTATIIGSYSGNEGQSITFNGSGNDPGTNDTLTYTWDFGDGTTGSGTTSSHTYNDNGTFTVKLTVTDNSGASGSQSKSVTIANVPPSANAGGPYSGNEGSTINFNGGGSSDPGTSDTLTYAWDFGDGATGSGVSVSHMYADNSNYTVILTVTDDDGGTDTDTITVPIANLDPTANAGGPYTTSANTPVTLSGSGTDIATDPLTFDWDLNNDGTFETSGQSVNFTRSTTGTYTVVLRVQDDDGGSATDTTTVQVNGLLPLAWLSLPFILARRKKQKRHRKFDNLKHS